jgi:hypothetical protein
MTIPYTAKFNDDQTVTLEPDTPETRADFYETMVSIMAGDFAGEDDDDGIIPIYLTDDELKALKGSK